MNKEEWLKKGYVTEPVDKTLDLKTEIDKLRKEKNALILGHYYQSGEIQDIADFVGDSLALAQWAAKTDADIIVMCGILFLGETKTRKEMRWLVIGIACFVLGAVLLGIVKSY